MGQTSAVIILRAAADVSGYISTITTLFLTLTNIFMVRKPVRLEKGEAAAIRHHTGSYPVNPNMPAISLCLLPVTLAVTGDRPCLPQTKNHIKTNKNSHQPQTKHVYISFETVVHKSNGDHLIKMRRV